MEESTRAAWEGSDVTQAEIDWLIRTWRIPAGVACRLPGPELVPDVQSGEYVVFVAHFERGFGLPVSEFMSNFLVKFRLQPHHISANTITTLSAYVSFSKGYLGLWPTINLWSKYFQFRKQVFRIRKPQAHPKS